MIAVHLQKQKKYTVDYTLARNVAKLQHDILKFGDFPTWGETIFQDIPYLGEANQNNKLNHQLAAAVTYVYTLANNRYERTKNLRQLEECYCALYCNGQLLGLKFRPK